jgi:hypothetical protein
MARSTPVTTRSSSRTRPTIFLPRRSVSTPTIPASSSPIASAYSRRRQRAKLACFLLLFSTGPIRCRISIRVRMTTPSRSRRPRARTSQRPGCRSPERDARLAPSRRQISCWSARHSTCTKFSAARRLRKGWRPGPTRTTILSAFRSTARSTTPSASQTRAWVWWR